MLSYAFPVKSQGTGGLSTLTSMIVILMAKSFTWKELRVCIFPKILDTVGSNFYYGLLLSVVSIPDDPAL
jgi:hypothetical protein